MSGIVCSLGSSSPTHGLTPSPSVLSGPVSGPFEVLQMGSPTIFPDPWWAESAFQGPAQILLQDHRPCFLEAQAQVGGQVGKPRS